MTDWTALAGGLDVSHYQGAIDWDAVVAAAPAFVAIKATQGLAVDPLFEANRRAAADRSLPWLPYPFLAAGDGDAEIRHFADVVGEMVPAMLDWEASGVAAAVVERWADGLVGELGRVPMAYYGLYPPKPATAAIGRLPRVLAEYPGSPGAAPRLPMWDGSADPDWRDMWFAWQWTPQGRWRGVASLVDLDRLACSAAGFRTWYDSGALPLAAALPGAVAPPLASPPPAVVGDPLMPLRALARPLHVGCTGADVTALQLALAAQGGRLAADGVFGRRETLPAVLDFQRRIGLDPPDGIVDRGGPTVAALLAFLEHHNDR